DSENQGADTVKNKSENRLLLSLSLKKVTVSTPVNVQKMIKNLILYPDACFTVNYT
ncbi:hypothetical protein AVEN_85473-1, partial [Araneus ventricosus]